MFVDRFDLFKVSSLTVSETRQAHAASESEKAVISDVGDLEFLGLERFR